MENEYIKSKEVLEKYGQDHIIKWMEKVDSITKEKIIKQVHDIDFEELNSLYENVGKKREKKYTQITKIYAQNKEKMEENLKQEYISTGEKILKANKYAVVTMAGGQGTRLGHNGPKGSFKVDIEPEGKYLFQILIEQLIEANKKYNIQIPYYIMTSKENNEQTIAFFEKMNYFGYPKNLVKFFRQAETALINKQGKLLIGEDKLIKFASNGNGEIYKSMKKNGIIEDMKEKNIEWLLITGIDNILVKLVDPLFLGITKKDGNLIASKSVIKQTPKESGGVFAKADGKPGVIEYVEIPDEIANEVDQNGEFLYGDMNIVNHLFKVEALDQIANEKLPYHTAVKTSKFMDENNNILTDSIYKFEKFIFDGFIYFKDMSLLRVKREEEFAPIKNAQGVDSPETAKKMYKDYMKTLKK